MVAPTLRPPQAGPPRPDHVVIVFEENRPFSQIIGSAQCPYFNQLASEGALLTGCYALTHPSQPNYFEFFAGDTQGNLFNDLPAVGSPFITPNLGAALLAAGQTFCGYAEGLPFAGSTVTSAYPYTRLVNPWVNWQETQTPAPNRLPAALNQPFSAFPQNFDLLPDVSIVVPNLLNSSHDGTLAQMDAWLVANIRPYADWAATHNSLLILTWDEDDGSERNRIATVLHGPMIRPGQYPTTVTLHNLLRTVADMYGAAPPGAAARVRSLTGPFVADPVPTVARFGGFDAGGVTVDTFVAADSPATSFGTDNLGRVDSSLGRQALIRFDQIVGDSPGQVPRYSRVVSAKVSLFTRHYTLGQDSAPFTVSAHRMLAGWDSGSTWDSMVGGVSLDDAEAHSAPDFTLLPHLLGQWAIFDVTDSAQRWVDDPASNSGWVFVADSPGAWHWTSSDGLLIADRPTFEISYLPPSPCPPDFNLDGFVDGIDSDLFHNAFEIGDPWADFNHDGFVDGLDADQFDNAFEVGC